MKNIKRSHPIPVLFLVLILSFGVLGQAQDMEATEQSQVRDQAVQVQTGQRIKVEGVVLQKTTGGLTLLCPGGIIYNVTISDTTEIKERKKNPFRGSRTYSEADLLQGLQIEVNGTGDSKGNLVARDIKMRDSDLEMAQTMDTRVVPVERELEQAQIRLDESEQNARRLSGQVQELSEVSNSARTSAERAQDSADQAMSAANNAKSYAEERVEATNQRITSLDEYSAGSTVIVLFEAGSSVLSDTAKSDLQSLASELERKSGFLVEVAGFASSDGNADYNRRLSQQRADAVIQYMAETFGIPLRRFVTPMGYGENQPIADNQTRAGRRQNRRVEVRILLSKGLTSAD